MIENAGDIAVAGFGSGGKRAQILVISGQKVPVPLDQPIHQFPDFVRGKLGRCVRVEQGRLVDAVAAFGQRGLDR